MSFEPVWGAPIAWYLFLAGLGGGAFITSAFLRWKHPEAHGMRASLATSLLLWSLSSACSC